MTPIDLLPHDFRNDRRCQRARYLWTNLVVGVVAVWIGTAAMVVIRHGQFAQDCDRLASELGPVWKAKQDASVFAKKTELVDAQRARLQSLLPTRHVMGPLAQLAAIRRASGAEGLVYAAFSSEGNRPFEIIVRSDAENIRRWREGFAAQTRQTASNDHPLVMASLRPRRRPLDSANADRRLAEPKEGLWIHGDFRSLEVPKTITSGRLANQPNHGLWGGPDRG